MVLDPETGKPSEAYDLIANQKRYVGVIRDHLADGQRLVLGPNEYVEKILPVNFETVREANENSETVERVPFMRDA